MVETSEQELRARRLFAARAKNDSGVGIRVPMDLESVAERKAAHASWEAQEGRRKMVDLYLRGSPVKFPA